MFQAMALELQNFRSYSVSDLKQTTLQSWNSEPLNFEAEDNNFEYRDEIKLRARKNKCESVETMKLTQ